MFHSRNLLGVRKVIVGYPNEAGCLLQGVFIIYEGSNIALLGRPPVGAGPAFGEHSLLNISRKTDIAVTKAVDVHKHGSADKESIFVDATILPLRDAG